MSNLTINNQTTTPATQQTNAAQQLNTALSGLNFQADGNSNATIQQLLTLVLQLLEQLQGGGTPVPPTPVPPTPVPPTPEPPTPEPPTPEPPTPEPPAPAPQAVNLTDSETNILTSLFATGDNGERFQNATLSATEGNSGVTGLSIGDTVTVTTADGQETNHVLTEQDMYEVRFRENMFSTVSSIGSGWSFANELVDIVGGDLNPPEQRQYTENDGSTATETVLERNENWEVVQRGQNRFMIMRETNDQGQPVLASDAINDIFNNRAEYRFDCATPMTLVNLKATLDTVGADDFNQNAGQIMMSTWYDQYDPNSNFDGGFISRVRTSEADGEVSVNGTDNLAGETALFDPSQGDALEIGSTYYFDLPGDNTSAIQGWNGVYMGQDDNGQHMFWTSSLGVARVDFPDDGSWIPTPGSSFDNYYLGAAIADPNIGRLQAWDTDNSVAR